MQPFKVGWMDFSPLGDWRGGRWLRPLALPVPVPAQLPLRTPPAFGPRCLQAIAPQRPIPVRVR
jgi:hypothetical protein